MPQYKHILKYLMQVEYYKDHIIEGEYHHKLLCRSCEKKAEKVFNKDTKYDII